MKSIGVLDTRFHLYIFVPRETRAFRLGIFDQSDDNPNAKASQFELYAPDGTLQRMLDAPQRGAWSDYAIESGGKWGVWRLCVTGPQDIEVAKGQKVEKARNAFMARTLGEVDLYLKPEPVARVRGLRLSEPRFGGAATHRFALQCLGEARLRFHILRESAPETSRLHLLIPRATQTRFALQNDDRLRAGITLETVEYDAPKPLRDVAPLEVANVRGTYGLGVEQESRIFFNAPPLQKLTRVALRATDENGRGVAARLEIVSPQTANETHTVYTDSGGNGAFFALPNANYRVTATRGFEFEPVNRSFTADAKTVSLALKRRWPHLAGWFGGDDHCHTSYYDGTHTPRQMVEAARAAGLDYAVVSEHGHSEKIERVQRANAEALAFNDAGRFAVIPGMEYTGPQFHANILGALLPVRSGAGLGEVLDAARTADSISTPIVVKLNHPTLGQTAAQIGRETPDLNLMELWNSQEPEATQLWWQLLNRGQRVWADTASDSHHRQNLEMGGRRTYVFLGDQPLHAANIVRALREGRSFLSRGAVVDFRLDGARPGATLPLSTRKSLPIRVQTHSSRPLESLEIIRDGAVVHRFEVGGKTDFRGEIALPAQAGWYLARAVERGTRTPELPLAMTNPIWIEKDSK